MKKIPITKGKFALVDDEDYPYLSRFKWTCQFTGRTQNIQNIVTGYYTETTQKTRQIPMHFFVTTRSHDEVITFRNGNPLDHQKMNLVSVPRGVSNHHHRKTTKPKSSIYKGVWRKKATKDSPGLLKVWNAEIKNKKHRQIIGTFYSEIEAARAYNKRAYELYGDLAYQNEIPGA